MESGSGTGGGRDTVLLAYPSSNQNVRADARALELADMLSLYCTTIAWTRGRALRAMLPSSLRQELERRVIDGIDPHRIKTFPAREFIHQAARRLRLTALTRHETGWASVDAVSRDFDERVARLIRKGGVRASAVYAYEYAALRTFGAARAEGMQCFYELPIGYWRVGIGIMTEELERNPAWASTIELLRDSDEKQERKDAEATAADHIIVPSDFVRETLREHPGFTATIDVVPYGAPAPRSVAFTNRPGAEKLRLLYVGHLSQRKGISYLFDAMRRLQGVATLTLVGPKAGGDCPALDAELRRHGWRGAVPHDQVLEIMTQHDVFVFPSLFEGFALVILEAMAQGLPVITTRNSGGTMAIDDGTSGFIVPIRSADAIVERVLILHGDRDRLASMSASARRKAERMSWAARGSAMIDVIRRRLALDDRRTSGSSRGRA